MTRARPSKDTTGEGRHPSAEFGTPEAVLERSDLTIAEKVAILQQWEYDEREVAVAVEEGMPDGEPNLLARILSALDSLTNGLDLEHGPPTKQGGV